MRAGDDRTRVVVGVCCASFQWFSKMKAAQNGRPLLHCIICFLGLFFAVLFDVSFHRLFRVSPGVNDMAPRCVCMVCCLLVVSGLVMLGRFPVVASGVRQML